MTLTRSTATDSIIIMIKFITALAFLPIAFASPAQALTCDVTSGGVQYCIDGKGNNRYGVTLSKGNEVETFDIQCHGKSLSSYESYGPLSQSEADSFAHAFCAL